MGNKIHLLCTGDLHLGRHPARIPEEYDSRNFSPTLIWEKIVQKSIKLKVDALLISGDVIDRDNRFYEAFGPFEAGLKKLKENNISIFAIAGNHDYDVLPNIAHNINLSNFYFLGAGGNWELQTLERDGKPVLNLLGWSYPGRQVHKSPLADLELLKNKKLSEDVLPTIGMIHSEVNAPASNYAPVAVDKLQEIGITGWLLGHIHKPYLITKMSPFILYPGSPQPLHPAEPGIHGVWEVIVKSKNNFEIIKHSLASLQYVNIEIDVSALERIEDLPALISGRIEEKLKLKRDIILDIKLIMARIIIKGRTKIYRESDNHVSKLQELELKIYGCRVLIEKIINETRPPLALESIAGGNSQVAILADYLLKLESGKGEQLPESLLREVENKLLEAYNSNAYQPLRKQNLIQPPGEEEVLKLLEKQARVLLDSLLAQKDDYNG